MSLYTRAALVLFLLFSQATQAATYAFRSDSYAWESAANNVVWEQTNTSYPRDDDKQVVNFTGGFTFTFGGVAYSSVRIHSNGALQFGADSAFHRVYSNANLPVSGHDRLIMMYWDDINPRSGGTVRYEQKGTAPNRYFVVSWENVPHYSLSGTYTFQVILYESGDFKYQYGSGNAAGASATIGVEVDDSDYTLFSYNNAWGTSGTAIRWSRASTTPSISAFYAFEDAAWNGASQEVFDRSSNDRHGTRVGNAQVTSAGQVCQGASIPANTSSASIDAINTAFDLDATLGSQGALTFWYKSNANWSSSGAKDAQLADATTTSNRWFFLAKDNNGRIRLVLTDSAGTTVNVETANNSYSANTWVHVAATWSLNSGTNQTVLRIYLNGSLVISRNVTTTGTLHGAISTLYLGDNRSTVIKTSGSDKGTANSANGTLDEVRLYNYEVSSAQVIADMNATHGCALDIRVGGFNVVNPGAHALTGTITTKTAGLAFELDLVALDGARTAEAASFSGDVLVDLIANTAAGVALDVDNCPTSGTTLSVGTVNLGASRTTHAFSAVAEAWRDVRVRVRYPATGTPTITACSTDNFAIKPASLSAVASHANWQAAGTAATLNNTSASGGEIHKAGQPFTLRVTGYNFSSTVTSQYDGSPTVQVTCVLPASGCAAGSLSTGTFTASGGTATSTTAGYSEVGAINAVFTDSVFAAVDSADTAADCSGYYACSAATPIGRFVPDHFEVSTNTPAFTPACGSFTYLGQPFGFGTRPRFTVTAKNQAGATTANYTGSLWKVTSATVTGQSWTGSSGTVEAMGSLPGPTVTDLGAGSGLIEFDVGDPDSGGGLRFVRGVLAAPASVSLTLAASVADSEGVLYAGNPYTLAGIGFDDGNAGTATDAEMRYGRLRLANAHGSERLALTVPLTAQYWNGQGFVTNTADLCTPLAVPTLSFFTQTTTNQLASGETSATFNTPLVAGSGNLRLSAPGTGNFGYLDITVTAPAWLRFNWDGTDQGSDGDLLDDNPRARASFGKRNTGRNVIMRREIY
ncbi:MAG: LamG domain-containing protein [Pseudomonadota bacterium]